LVSPEVLTAELRARIVTVCATFPTWSAERVYHYLQEQGSAVTLPQVQQAISDSGWRLLQQTLSARYVVSDTTVQLREAWLVGQLLDQIEVLLSCLERGQPWPGEAQSCLADVLTLAQAAGASAAPPVKTLPWVLRLEQLLWGQWQAVPEAEVHCPQCGSTQIGRKSAQPRWKKYYDAAGQVQQVAVYRYYCRNPQCPTGSFTNLPPGLVPYSPYRTEVHLLAIQMYAWGYSTYRRTGAAVGVASLTVWRWVSAFGATLLPVAALFGVVRSSGVGNCSELPRDFRHKGLCGCRLPVF
jgi:hypothetical protein